MKMNLNQVKRGVIKEHARRVLMYAPEGIGKSTFAAGAPNPIFLCPEDGTYHLDVARFPEPQSWADVLDAVTELRKSNHEFKTFVIDTLDWIEPMCWARVCQLGQKKNIEEFGYGKGYIAALDEWRGLISNIDALRRDKGMTVILLGHAIVRTFKNPDGEDYDRFNMKLHEKASGLFKEWADTVLFANFETFTRKVNGRSKGESVGSRVMHTERRASFDAKNRDGLPDTLPLSWAEFESACGLGDAEKAATLRAEIRLQLEGKDIEYTKKIEEWLSKTGNNTSALATGLNRLLAKEIR